MYLYPAQYFPKFVQSDIGTIYQQFLSPGQKLLADHNDCNSSVSAAVATAIQGLGYSFISQQLVDTFIGGCDMFESSLPTFTGKSLCCAILTSIFNILRGCNMPLSYSSVSYIYAHERQLLSKHIPSTPTFPTYDCAIVIYGEQNSSDTVLHAQKSKQDGGWRASYPPKNLQ